MSATPDRPEGDKSKKPMLSRIKKIKTDKKDDDYRPEMPPIDAGYLVAYLFEIGPVISGSMGAGPIEWPHIDAWCNRIGIDLSPWESRTIRQLSTDYFNESYRATDIDCVAPWTESTDVIEAPNQKAESMRLALRKLAEL